MFSHSPFHSIISEAKPCQNKLCPITMLKLMRFFSSSLISPIRELIHIINEPVSLNHIQQSQGLENSFHQSSSSQNQPLPCHWHITKTKLSSFLITNGGHDTAEDSTLSTQGYYFTQIIVIPQKTQHLLFDRVPINLHEPLSFKR